MSDLKEPLLAVTACDEEPHVIVARTNNKDGSISLKVTTSTTYPNGYTDVKVELFEVPDSMSSAVDEELGIIPNEYLNRVEYRVLPPGTLEEDFADDNTVYTHMTQQKGCDASTVRISNLRKRRCPDWKRIIFASVLFMAAWVLTAALLTDLGRESSSHSPEQASQSTTADAAATDAAKASILPESNSTRTDTDTDKNTTELLYFDSYFAPVTISHLLGTHQRQFHLGVRDKPRI
eukprot:scaffold33530_cov119-Skeletonema_dohrnii-CCMP3373.AAC.11